MDIDLADRSACDESAEFWSVRRSVARPPRWRADWL